MSTRDKGTVIFHSASIPQLIIDDENLMAQKNDNDIDVSGVKKIKNYKYQFYTLYYQPKMCTKKNDPTKHKYKQYVIRRKKFIIGNANVKDLSSGSAMANPLTVKSMRTRVKQWIIGQPDFNKSKVLSKGGFLSKQFWQNNLMWGPNDDFIQNFITTTAQVKADLPQLDLRIAFKLKGTKRPSKTTLHNTQTGEELL